MAQIKPNHKNLIIHLLSSICIFILLATMESKGDEYIDNKINSAQAINTQSSGIDTSMFASLMEETPVLSDSLAVDSEKKESTIHEKSK